MTPTEPPRLVEVLAEYDRLVEVGIGNRPDVAVALAARGVTVRATDRVERSVPAGVSFALDDVTGPDEEVYADADAIYALRMPPELQRATRRVSSAVGAPFLFTTLGGDPAVIPAERKTVREGTLFVAPAGGRGVGQTRN
ncbi:MAG: UPF0146 family protein [Halanaeroarchaeum sp.]